jgi:hypothetical protein
LKQNTLIKNQKAFQIVGNNRNGQETYLFLQSGTNVPYRNRQATDRYPRAQNKEHFSMVATMGPAWRSTRSSPYQEKEN